MKNVNDFKKTKMSRTNFDELLEAGVHFGHLKRKWNPAMAPYIFMERNGIHILDLHKTVVKIDEAAEALKQISKSGRKILFVATKKQAKEIIAEKVGSANMPYVVERWPGGMLTNFPTIRKAVKKMGTLDKLMSDPASWQNLSKRERLQISRQRAKLEKTLGSIADLTRLPAAMFIIDVMKEHIAVREANRLGIPVFGMVDTNSDPSNVDFVIPANDDATKSIELITDIMIKAIKEGLDERKLDKDSDGDGSSKGKKEGSKKVVTKKTAEFTEEEEVVEDEELTDDSEEEGEEEVAEDAE
jgi:small subunit ribosomal protein S2